MSRLNDGSDWSDSEDEDRNEAETSVLLGIPDGIVDRVEDLNDAAVSRLGGHPAFLTSEEPPLSSSQCGNCSYPMELLVQLWCPFEESSMDRALYVFSCGRSECQRKSGSIRAFRGLRFNAAYASKLKKKARRRELRAESTKVNKQEEKERDEAKSNPFCITSGMMTSNRIFNPTPDLTTGLGSQLFGATIFDTEHTHEYNEDEEDAAEPPPSDVEDCSDSSESDSVSEVLAAPTSTPSASSSWYNSPKYTPSFYLSTAREYLPSPPNVKLSGRAILDMEDGPVNSLGKSRKAESRREQKEKENIAWNNALEGYEDSLELDRVFECFSRRTAYEGEQCIRYELGGIPLPFTRDAVFDALFPSPDSISKETSPLASQAKSTHGSARRKYNSQSPVISPCPRCGGRRIFECQLMPHLISVLQSSASGQEGGTGTLFGPEPPPSLVKDRVTIEQRKKEIEQLLKHGAGRRAMGWGSCLIFSCEKDCCQEDERETRETWAEELVLVQWDES